MGSSRGRMVIAKLCGLDTEGIEHSVDEATLERMRADAIAATERIVRLRDGFITLRNHRVRGGPSSQLDHQRRGYSPGLFCLRDFSNMSRPRALEVGMQVNLPYRPSRHDVPGRSPK